MTKTDLHSSSIKKTALGSLFSTSHCLFFLRFWPISAKFWPIFSAAVGGSKHQSAGGKHGLCDGWYSMLSIHVGWCWTIRFRDFGLIESHEVWPGEKVGFFGEENWMGFRWERWVVVGVVWPTKGKEDDGWRWMNGFLFKQMELEGYWILGTSTSCSSDNIQTHRFFWGLLCSSLFSASP